MGIFSRNTKIQIPVPHVQWVKRYETTREAVAIVAWSTLLFIVVASFALGGTYWCVSRIVTPPPKVVTQVVHESAMTAAQNEFIKQCEAARKDTNPSDSSQPVNSGIPNVNVTPYTCVFGN